MRRADDPLSRQLLRAALVIAGCTLVAAALQRQFEPSNLIVVFMAGIVYLAATSSRAVAWGAIAVSIGVLDLAFVAPRSGFAFSRAQDLVTLAVIFAVGALMTELAARARREAADARLRADRLQALNSLSLALAAAPDAPAVSRSVCQTLRESLGVQARMQTEEGPGGEPLGAIVVDAGLPLDAAAREFIAGASAQARLALARLVSEARSEAAAVQAESERLRNTLLSGISHDFRTPLTTIVGATTSLIEQEAALDPATRRQLLHSVLREARRMHVVTSTLLDLTRMQEGALQPRFEWCPADELVQEVLRAMQPALAGRQVHAEVDGDPPVWCDPDLIERVLSNLLDNAARHTPAGGRIDISAGHGDGWWELRVADTGPGLPPGAEERIFRKFVQASPGRDGTGLGLALCTAIAGLHGGTIRTHNDGGAVFTLRLAQPGQMPEELET